tara:strand:- start:2775 stop:2981 length:207 start_codon:yes stop_codon:yes gene_type:complete
MNIQIGDLVKFSGVVIHQYGVQFGTVIGDDEINDSNEVKVMMYNAGLGQFTQWIHVSLLERVTPVGRL